MDEKRIKTPSRLLNEQRGFFGLYMSDFAMGIGIFIAFSTLFDGKSYELLSALIAFIFLLLLSPIRLSTRRKIVRDYLLFFSRSKVLYDPKRK